MGAARVALVVVVVMMNTSSRTAPARSRPVPVALYSRTAWSGTGRCTGQGNPHGDAALHRPGQMLGLGRIPAAAAGRGRGGDKVDRAVGVLNPDRRARRPGRQPRAGVAVLDPGQDLPDRVSRRRPPPTSRARPRGAARLGARPGSRKRAAWWLSASRHSRSGTRRRGRSAEPPPPGIYRRAVTFKSSAPKRCRNSPVLRLLSGAGAGPLSGQEGVVRTFVLALLIGLAAGGLPAGGLQASAHTGGTVTGFENPESALGTARPGRSTFPTWAPARSTRGAGSRTDT